MTSRFFNCAVERDRRRGVYLGVRRALQHKEADSSVSRFSKPSEGAPATEEISSASLSRYYLFSRLFALEESDLFYS